MLQKRPVEVEKLIDRLREQKKDLPLPLFSILGKSYLAQKRYDEAELQFRYFLSAFEKQKKSRPSLMSKIYFNQSLKGAFFLNRSLEGALLNLGNLYQEQGRTDEAASFFNRAEAIKKGKSRE